MNNSEVLDDSVYDVLSYEEDEAAIRKRVLQNMFIAKLKENRDRNLKIGKEQPNAEVVMVKKKSKNKQFTNVDKDISSLNVLLKNERLAKKKCKESLKKLEKENKKIKDSRFALQAELREQRELASKKNIENEALRRTILKLQAENAALNKSLSKINTSKERQQLSSLKSRNVMLKKSVNSLKRELKEKSTAIENLNLLKTGEVDNTTVMKLSQRLIDKSNEVANLRSRLATYDTAIVRLNEKLYCRNKAKVMKKILARDMNFSGVSIGESVEEESVEFGFLSVDGFDNLVFVNIYKRVYMVNTNNVEKLKELLGIPVKAIVSDDGTVRIKSIYKNIGNAKVLRTMNTDVRANRDNRYVKAKRAKQFNGEKVLVIGSRFKDKYVGALKEVGLTVIWHDGYGDSEKRLYDLAPSADVVIICTSHTPHSVLNVIHSVSDYDGISHKYQEIEKDSCDNLIGRVRYSLVNMNNEKSKSS